MIETPISHASKNLPGPNAPSSMEAPPPIPIKKPHFTVTPAKLWTSFLYRWKSALLVGVVFAMVGAGVAWLTYKPKYTAVTSMRMSSSKQRILPGNAEDHHSFAREADFQKTQAQLVKSRDVIAVVLEKEQIRGLTMFRDTPSPHQWLEKELQANFVTGTDILRIGLSGVNPEEITLVVNMVRKVFSDQFNESAKKHQYERSETIDDVMAKTQGKIDDARKDMKRLASVHKTGDPQALTLKQHIALEEYSALKKEAYGIETEMRRANAMLVVQRNELTAIEHEKLPPEVIDDFLSSQPTVKKLQMEVTRLEVQIKEYNKVVTADSPRLRQLESDLKTAREQVQKAKTESLPEADKKLRAALQRQRMATLQQTQDKLNVLSEQYKVVAEQVTQRRGEAESIGTNSVDIEMNRGKLVEAESTMRKLSSEKERMEIEKLNKRKYIDSEQPAEVPTVNQASILKTGSLYSLAAFVLGCLAVSYLEARLHRVYRPADIQHGLGIQTLGMTPLLAQDDGGAYGRALPSTQSLSGIMFVDAVNTLCAKLLCDDRLSKHAVLMVTSASEDEGKTLIATQLASGLARTGKRTLILDCDFRKPRCHQQLGIAAGPGLSEVLSGEVELAAAFQNVPDSEAHILTAGQSNPQVVKTLSNGKFADLLKRLRQDFDCIIIDSAPTLLVSDGLLIGKLADGVLLVVRSQVSKSPAVFAAYDQLAALKIPTLGAVVNGNPMKPWRVYQ